MKKLIVLVIICGVLFIIVGAIYKIKNIYKKKGIYYSRIQEVIDGDIIKLSNGKIIDLVGVYLPKEGEANYRKKLVDNLKNLVLGKELIIETVEEKNIDYPKYALVKLYVNIL